MEHYFRLDGHLKERKSWLYVFQFVLGLFYSILGVYKLYMGRYFWGALFIVGGALFIVAGWLRFTGKTLTYVRFNGDGITLKNTPMGEILFIPWSEITSSYIGVFTIQFLTHDHQIHIIDLNNINNDQDTAAIKALFAEMAQHKNLLLSDYPLQ